MMVMRADIDNSREIHNIKIRNTDETEKSHIVETISLLDSLNYQHDIGKYPSAFIWQKFFSAEVKIANSMAGTTDDVARRTVYVYAVFIQNN